MAKKPCNFPTSLDVLDIDRVAGQVITSDSYDVIEDAITKIENWLGIVKTGTGAIVKAVSPALTTPTGIVVGDIAGAAAKADKLSAFAATTSAELAGVISDETGTDKLVYNTSPTFVTKITTPIIDLTSGQIAFPASAVPSANVNTLDDYEEGTWVPVYTSTNATFTYINHSGLYTKIGRMVFLSFVIITTAVSGTTTNEVTITGLPFVPMNSGGITIAVCNLAKFPSGEINTSTNSIRLWQQGTMANLVAADIAGDGQYFFGSGFYSI